MDVRAIERPRPFRDTALSADDVNRRLAAEVRAATNAHELPVVLAGSCDAALGVLAGFEHARCGAVWLDAHGDFNTPDSTASGFFPGMSLAVVVGHCYRRYWSGIGDGTPIEERAVALFGVRDLSPDEERERLERSSIQVVPWSQGTPDGDVGATLDELRRRVADVYLHVDLDAFAPEVARGVADEPLPGASRPRMGRGSSARRPRDSAFARRRSRRTRRSATRVTRRSSSRSGCSLSSATAPRPP